MDKLEQQKVKELLLDEAIRLLRMQQGQLLLHRTTLEQYFLYHVMNGQMTTEVTLLALRWPQASQLQLAGDKTRLLQAQ